MNDANPCGKTDRNFKLDSPTSNIKKKNKRPRKRSEI